jgi:hypothetical protein
VHAALPFDDVTRRGSGGASPYTPRAKKPKPLFGLAAFGQVHFDIFGGYGSVH